MSCVYVYDVCDRQEKETVAHMNPEWFSGARTLKYI